MSVKVLKIGQVSDIHIGEDESLVQGIDVRSNFLKAVQSDTMKDLDLLVLSGDLANENAEPGAYRFVADTIKSLKCPVCIIPGNHDDIDVMAKFFDIPAKNGKCYFRYDLDGRSIFFLDSACGVVSRDQLEWLESEIPKVDGEVLLFMHHPPCFCNHRFMDLHYYLHNMVEVQQVLSQFKNLNHVFCGHYHNDFHRKFAHIDVHVAPSTQMQIDPEKPYFSMRSTEPGWHIIRWGDSVENEVIY